MRILEAFGEPIEFGGEEMFVTSFLEAMNIRNAEIELFTPYTCSNVNIRRSYKVRALGLPFVAGRSRNNLKEPIREFLATNKYDIIHIHSGSMSMLAIYAQLAAEAGIEKIIVHAHCAGIPNLKHTIARLLTGRALRKYPTSYLACSAKASQWMFPAEIQDRVQVMKNGIDTLRFAYDEGLRVKIRAELGVSDALLIGFVGRLCEEKNPEFLLDIAAQNGATLLYVGDGELKDSLETSAESRGIKAIFTGAVADVERYYQAMDCFVLPSRFEGFSLVTLEAQASGLPCIVSDAVSEEINVTSLVERLKPDDPVRWAKAVAEAAKYRSSRAEELANKGFDIKDVASRIERIYFE